VRIADANAAQKPPAKMDAQKKAEAQKKGK
jgi:hypothetical protein